jgi:hypothetical protein
MHLPQRQYHKLYKAVAPFCRRLNTDDGMSSEVASAFPMAPSWRRHVTPDLTPHIPHICRSPPPSRWRRRPTTTPAPPTPPRSSR